MEFILSVMHKLRNSFNSNISLRQGLPIDFFKRSNFNDLLKEQLSKITFEPNSCYPTEHLKDFMRSRLPPYSSNLTELYSISELGIFLIIFTSSNFKKYQTSYSYLLLNKMKR